ncbi:UrcA family protein [Caulobacter sp. NIBR2454]|uniref:UrcA family protein n=1 Tax=Caulobacter sp. NIBR2454 TaxID=3015996 RepID=UPI0022B7126A|nr:UrcA family protein [Caulobacter sp. NIBR2454]
MLKTVFAAAAFSTFIVAAGVSQAEVAVKFSDLDLSKASGAAKLEQRISRASRAMCAVDRGAWAQQAECRAAVREEFQTKLAAIKPASQLASR